MVQAAVPASKPKGKVEGKFDLSQGHRLATEMHIPFDGFRVGLISIVFGNGPVRSRQQVRVPWLETVELIELEERPLLSVSPVLTYHLFA
jgi:hypothetical protein